MQTNFSVYQSFIFDELTNATKKQMLVRYMCILIYSNLIFSAPLVM